MKKIISLLLTLSLLLSLTVPVLAGNDITVKIDGKIIDFDVPPQLINNRTMVPLRAIFEALGASVEWNGETQTVTSTKDKTTISLTINSTLMVVNGKDVALDSPACLIDGRTLVPVRAISEAFGTTVEWNGKTSTVLLTNKINPYTALKDWILKNGEENSFSATFRELELGDYDGEFNAAYDADSDSIKCSVWSQVSDTIKRSNFIILKDGTEYKYEYETASQNTVSNEVTHKMSGVINAPEYSQEASLPYEKFEGPKEHETEFAKMNSALTVVTTTCFYNFLALKLPEITTKDFGFTYFD